MSNHLTSLAYKADVGSLLRKAVLVMLSDKASDDGSGIWASKQTMADELCCSKQAVLKTLREFISEKLLAETGRRKNRNGYTITYSINVPAMEKLPLVKRWCDQSTPLTGQPDEPVNPVDGDQSTPLTQTSLRTTQCSEAKASSQRAKFSAPIGVTEDQWGAFRKQRRKPINERSYTLIRNKLTKLAEDGWPPGDMIDLAIERGWETVFEPRDQKHGQPASDIASLRGNRPDPALDLLRAARAAEDREDRWGAGPSLPTIRTG